MPAPRTPHPGTLGPPAPFALSTPVTPIGDSIPRPTVRRLSLYLREAESMLQAGLRTVSSSDFSLSLPVTDAQVRRDLGHLGQRGRPGVGYSLTPLIERLRRALAVDRSRNVAIIGAGRIGRALMAYPRFGQRGFRIVAVFDTDTALIGRTLDGHLVQELGALEAQVKSEDIEIGVIAVPEAVANTVAHRLIDAGVTGLLNLAPCHLGVPVPVINVDLSSSLEELAWAMTVEN